jgi:hypothetical protein
MNEPVSGGRPRTSHEELAQETEWLSARWREVAEDELPPGLAERTVARVGRERPGTGRVLRVDWRVRLGSAAGLAAALLLGLGLTWWHGSSQPLSASGPDWAAGLELPERFESRVHETEVRLERLAGLLEEPAAAGSGGDAAELRRRLDRLAEEMEVF